MTILIVDDEEGIRESYRLYFEDKGYKVYTAPDCKESLRVVGQHDIDIAVIDLRLKRNVSGVQVAKKLLDVAHNLKLFFMSSIITMPDTIQGFPLINKRPKIILEQLKKIGAGIVEEFEDEEGDGH